MTSDGSRRIVVGIGANLGHRLAALQGAVDALAALPRTRVIAVSGVVETDPVGGPEQPDYLNAVVILDSALEAAEVLRHAQAIEADWDRTREVRWGPRTLDIDILAVADDISADPALTLPHPRATERAFVLVPWLDADPHAVVPGAGPVADLLAALGSAGVRPRPDLSLRPPGGPR